MDEKQKQTLRTGIILIAFGVCLYSVLQHLNDFATGVNGFFSIIEPILTGMAIAFVINVLMLGVEHLLGMIRPLAKNSRLLRSLALLLTLVLAAGLIVLVFLVIIPKLGEALSLLAAALPTLAASLSDWLSSLREEFAISDQTINALKTSVTNITSQLLSTLESSTGVIANYVLGTVKDAVSIIMNFFFSLIIAVYLLIDKERIARFAARCINHLLPTRYALQITSLASLSYKTFSGFIRGQLIEAMILGAMCFFGMLLFGFPHAAAVSLLVGVTALIPIFGAWIGGIIAAFLVAMVDPLQGAMMIVFFLVLQQVEGNLIYPRVVGSSIGLPGILVLSAVIIGQGLFGVVGILFAVPLTAVAYTLLRQHLQTRPAARSKQ